MTRLPMLAGMIVGAAGVAHIALSSAHAAAEPLKDLHDLAIGMSAEQLPAVGYRDLRCADRPIATWRDWANCPMGAEGLRVVRVAYDHPDGETRVAGHPVDLSVSFDASGRVARIEIETDDHAAPYLHKKAYMLARQAKAHYGEEFWTCKSVPAATDEEPIGPIYLNESCVKQSAERRIEVRDRLFRRRGAGPRDFVSDARITIGLPAAKQPQPAPTAR